MRYINSFWASLARTYYFNSSSIKVQNDKIFLRICWPFIHIQLTLSFVTIIWFFIITITENKYRHEIFYEWIISHDLLCRMTNWFFSDNPRPTFHASQRFHPTNIGQWTSILSTGNLIDMVWEISSSLKNNNTNRIF